MARVGIKLGPRAAARNCGYAITEDLALTLGLLFRALAPMRSRDNMRAVAEGIEAMDREEAAYWLGHGDAPPASAPGADRAAGAAHGAAGKGEGLETMKLKSVEIENYRAIEKLTLPLDPALTVLHGDNTCGKTSVLSAVAVGLSSILEYFVNFSKVDFLETDVRTGASFVQVAVTSSEGIAWKRKRLAGMRRRTTTRGHHALRTMMSRIADVEADDSIPMPVVAFYDTDRIGFNAPKGWKTRGNLIRRYASGTTKEEMSLRLGGKYEFFRHLAVEDALTARTNFPEFFTWFYTKENDELREQKQHHDFSYQRKDLSAVRRAISSMLDGVSDPCVDVEPLRFSVSVTRAGRHAEKLELDQLSGGQRAVLALAADLAWRMALGNPHLEDPLSSEAIVLIDEVELHLHPSWQQRILNDLQQTFPNAQFIVSTHSAQVLSTVEPTHIVELAREDDRIVAGRAAGWTYGAEAGDILSAVMGVNERPDNDFTKKLARYRRLVSSGEGESEKARTLRRELDDLSAGDPALDRADIEIRRRKLLHEMGKST